MKPRPAPTTSFVILSILILIILVPIAQRSKSTAVVWAAANQQSRLTELDGAAIYKQRCALCHESSSATRAPAPNVLRLMSPDNIVRALESGVMKEQGAGLSPGEKNKVAEFLTGRTTGQAKPESTTGVCPDAKAAFSLSGPNWASWGADVTNTRFQPADRAGISADQAPRLQLKWAFGFSDTPIALGQPTIVGGRVFVASANRKVYSLDAKSGCRYWYFEPDAPARTAISVATLPGSQSSLAAFFGDRRGRVYALNAATGELLWKVSVEDVNPRAGITGSPAYFAGRLYVPVTDNEEGIATDPKYECCKGRGALVALDAATGKQIWKTYTVSEDAQLTGKSKSGTPRWGPSGASIWSAPTVDEERKLIYAGTGDNFSDPPSKTSDAVIAFDMQTGRIVWVKQLTQNDAFTVGCRLLNTDTCPDSAGPDFDIGSPPILVKLPSGKRVLLVGQKSGVARGLDPDHEGAILWEQRVGRGTTLGGIQWGSAYDGRNLYVANSDISFMKPAYERGEKRVVDPNPGGGLFALNPETGAKVWSASPRSCGERPFCSPAQSAPVSAIPGVVFSGSVDAHLRAYSAADGKVIWDVDTARDYSTVNGVPAKGGSMDAAGPAIAGGMLFVNSGYGTWGGLPGNVLLAFSVDGK